MKHGGRLQAPAALLLTPALHTSFTSRRYTVSNEAARGVYSAPTSHKEATPMSRTTRLLLTLAVALVALCATFGSAAAAPRAVDTPPPGNTSLERAYQAEKQQ